MWRRVMWWAAARQRSRRTTMTPVWSPAVGEVEAVPRLVVGAVLERQAAEVGRPAAVEGDATARFGADRDRAGAVGEP